MFAYNYNLDQVWSQFNSSSFIVSILKSSHSHQSWLVHELSQWLSIGKQIISLPDGNVVTLTRIEVEGNLIGKWMMQV